MLRWMEHLRAATTPGGPSSTKIGYLATVYAVLLSASALTASLAYVYLRTSTADPTLAAATTGLWTAALGFVTSAQNRKNDADKELALGKAAER